MEPAVVGVPNAEVSTKDGVDEDSSSRLQAVLVAASVLSPPRCEWSVSLELSPCRLNSSAVIPNRDDGSAVARSPAIEAPEEPLIGLVCLKVERLNYSSSCRAADLVAHARIRRV